MLTLDLSIALTKLLLVITTDKKPYISLAVGLHRKVFQAVGYCFISSGDLVLESGSDAGAGSIRESRIPQFPK